VARYRIEHLSRYAYDQPVTSSFNEARLTPLATRWQTPLESVLKVDAATWQYRYVDYWGTSVRAFEANAAHRELVVEASSLVEVDPQFRPSGDPHIGWDAVASGVSSEFVAQSASTEPPVELAELARDIAADNGPHATGLAVSAAVHDAMTYRPGSTGVHTVAAEAWAARSGVCQDYAHLVVGALRHAGLPARYVSGYLHPKKDPVIGERAGGESHAWVEWWLGEWYAFDPTNAAAVAERHVMVGAGRDYGDVPPIKGIVAGTPVTTNLSVEVTLTKLA
jgi:transglutaminase-like putative cysteine protease